MENSKVTFDTGFGRAKGCPPNLFPAMEFLKQIPRTLQNSLKSHMKHLEKKSLKFDIAKPQTWMETLDNKSSNALEVNLDKQLKAWEENPSWSDQPSEILVSVPKGSLCNLKVKVNVGWPPDAVYNIVIDPENRRVFKNIKEVLYRKVLLDEGHRQVVELEQAAIWRFLWWSGTIAVHVFVDQNRKDHSLKFKQGKTGFMEKFEGRWQVEPLFVDEHYCYPHKPRTLEEYEACTKGKGRIGSTVTLDQLIQPAIIPPPPISWYLRGITAKTTEMLINDLLAETARLREAASKGNSSGQVLKTNPDSSTSDNRSSFTINDRVKERWQQRRRRCRPKRMNEVTQ